jgi:hypothetical protein
VEENFTMRKYNNFKLILLLSITLSIFSSCSDDIDDEILPILGLYDAHLVGYAGPFSMNITSQGNDDILIDAPFDGDIWSIVSADIDNADEYKWDIDIYRQSLAPGIEIWGDGFYFNGTIQLNYSISFWGDVHDYTIVGDR